MNTLRQALEEYLAIRRALGFRLVSAGRQLARFVTFMEQHRASYITHALALEWAQLPSDATPTRWAQRLSYVRAFARYRRIADPRTQVPPPDLLPLRPKRARPYIYSSRQTRDLLRAARRLPSNISPLKPWTYHCLFGLLSVTGMRLSEVLNLELKDIDLTTGVLTIRGAKFGRDRLVPVHASTSKVLARYIARRTKVWATQPVAPYLLLSKNGTRLDCGDVHRNFYLLSRRIGLRGLSDSRGPRLHDYRHTVATKTLLRWYRTGKDAERLLPVLSAYLGHVHPRDTYWYLSFNPSLMRAAMRRLETCWGDRS